MLVGGPQKAPVYRTGVEVPGGPVSQGTKVWEGVESPECPNPQRGCGEGRLGSPRAKIGVRRPSVPKNGLGVDRSGSQEDQLPSKEPGEKLMTL